MWKTYLTLADEELKVKGEEGNITGKDFDRGKISRKVEN